MLVVFRLPPANWPYYSGSLSLSTPFHLSSFSAVLLLTPFNCSVSSLARLWCWPAHPFPVFTIASCRTPHTIAQWMGHALASSSAWNSSANGSNRSSCCWAWYLPTLLPRWVSVRGTRWNMSKEAFPHCRSSVALCWKWLMPVSELVDRPPRRLLVSMSFTCSGTQMSQYSLQTLLTLRRSRPRWPPVIWWRH